MSGLRDLPRPAVRVDGALTVLDWSRSFLVLFRVKEGDPAAELGRALSETEVLGDEMALATARLTSPGDEDSFVWQQEERQFQVSVSAEVGGDSFLAWFEDVTEARRMEDIQLEARHYLEQVLADVPIGVAVLDQRLRVTFVNVSAQRLFGAIGARQELVDVIGSGLQELVEGGAGARWQDLCARARDEGSRAGGEREEFAVDGSSLVLAVAAHPRHDRRGVKAGAILVIEDVTEQARLEGQLIRMEKLATVGQMVITVNHEINNPLAIINTNAQSARLLNKSLDEKTVAKLMKIEEQVKRISDVTERLRTMDEVESNDYIADGPQMIDIHSATTKTEDGS